ncbi:hypothetical protein [uncultured Microscilla sp.]|uniref:hypothetical protein n=1 Tax=uncultured Microscilla sp. TaxID=432653 RepID=UPI002630FC25|nr:hypothetical protein [uncultured Microscilla sp.]
MHKYASDNEKNAAINNSNAIPADAKITKQSGLPPIQTKEGSKPPIQAKQRPIQRNKGNEKSGGNVNEDQVKANVSSIMGVDVTGTQVNQ